MRSLCLGVAVATLLASCEVAHPCGGGPEAPGVALVADQRRYGESSDQVGEERGAPSEPFLAPGNDTQTNLESPPDGRAAVEATRGKR